MFWVARLRESEQQASFQATTTAPAQSPWRCYACVAQTFCRRSAAAQGSWLCSTEGSPSYKACTRPLVTWFADLSLVHACGPQVVPPLQLTPEQLAQHDGSDPDKPLLLSICGTVLDVTAGEPPGRDSSYAWAGWHRAWCTSWVYACVFSVQMCAEG